MTIDISQLSQEKRAFLKVNPDFLKGFEQAVPNQAAKIQKRKKKRTRGLSKLQRDLEDIDRRVAEARTEADKLRREYMMHLPPALRRLHFESMRKDVIIGEKQLVCPNCGRTDAKNKRGSKPWCIYCHLPLVPKNKVERWKKMIRFKPLSKRKREDEFKHRGLDF